MNAIRRQRGATMIVALIMIATITLLVVSSFTLSSTNLKSVSNMQARDEAIAAANQAIEQVISSNFTSSLPPDQEINVDINADGTNDYTVTVYTPTCVRAHLLSAARPTGIGIVMPSASGTTWFTDWDIRAKAEDAATGSKVFIRQGLRVPVDAAVATASCT